ncbi:potassium-transporting ATPase subunit C [Bradyrhizobium sp. SK17]|jgi:K+-transporting ATPase ATPase C chain|uniref:potassium-transporting ATPase subunit KdpC n=1 Tax=Hyphomicrobiales TaxID=356 RepID=UPI000929BA58|nr:potassium-transporting ATPase subunit KdpC [Rhizobium sp. 60-20]AUC97574.1 potassium-transporting ATPase subunit C [Bradyrhizobium sp. SK17]MBN8949827.1 potassium-transporting ATPase subunit KdpC [Rhizobium tropici]OJY62785.1 MAG: potassium-transporting ATPase subunit C [Rhizobium sp. 60-20]
MREISKTTNTHASAGPLLGGLTRPVLVSAVFFMAVTGIAYPLATTGVATLFFPAQSRGSIVTADGKDVGSRVIGQYFTRPDYFHGRPSTTSGTDPNDPSKTVDQPYNAAASGASNQGAISKKLIEAVTERTAAYREENGLAANAPVPIDAVTASGSGLDPHISLANARLQVARVAKARGLSPDKVMELVDQNTSGRQLGVLGDPRINVLELNLALDAAAPARPAAQ